MKIRPIGTELFHADRRTNTAKLIAVFRMFANAPKMWPIFTNFFWIICHWRPPKYHYFKFSAVNNELMAKTRNREVWVELRYLCLDPDEGNYVIYIWILMSETTSFMFGSWWGKLRHLYLYPDECNYVIYICILMSVTMSFIFGSWWMKLRHLYLDPDEWNDVIYIWILIWQMDCGCGQPYIRTLFQLNCSWLNQEVLHLATIQHIHTVLASSFIAPVMWCCTRMRQSMTCDLQETGALVLRAQLNVRQKLQRRLKSL
jgi:hypothetical protein